MEASNGSRCRGLNRAGLRCARRAVNDGYCTAHHPTEGQDMRELGRKGGQVRPLTKLRQSADDELRELARQTLAKSLRGEKVDPQQLAAAKSLFSYGAEAPPLSQGQGTDRSGGMRFSFESLVESAAECRFFSQLGWLAPEVEFDMLERVRHRNVGGGKPISGR